MPYHSKKLPALVFCSLIDNNCFGWFLPRGVGRGWGHFSKSTKMRNEQKYAQAQLFNVSQNGVIQKCIALERFSSLVQESSSLFDARNGIQTRVGQYQWTRCQRSTEYTKWDLFVIMLYRIHCRYEYSYFFYNSWWLEWATKCFVWWFFILLILRWSWI